jgi:hypothetical protein
MRRRFLRFAAAAISALALSGCATMTVSSHVQRGLDFSQYRTYDWGPADALPTGDPRLDKNPFFRDHVEGAVEKQLAARGFSRSTSGTADLLLHYHASITQRIDVNGVDRGYGYYCYGGDCHARVIGYEAGTLVLDVVDTRTNRVIWRGWAQDSVEDVIDNQDKMARKINQAVTRMLGRFPREIQPHGDDASREVGIASH